MNLRQIIFSVYVAIFAALSVATGLYFVDTREQYNLLKAREARNRRQLEVLEHNLQEQQRILDRLRNDPAYVERVIRKTLGYAKPDEEIFRFDN